MSTPRFQPGDRVRLPGNPPHYGTLRQCHCPTPNTTSAYQRVWLVETPTLGIKRWEISECYLRPISESEVTP